MAQVGRTVLVGWRPHGDVDALAEPDAFRSRGGKRQPTASAVIPHQFFQPRLVEWHNALAQLFHLRGIDIDTHDLIARLGQTGPCHQADVACTEYRDFHAHPPKAETRSAS